MSLLPGDITTPSQKMLSSRAINNQSSQKLLILANKKTRY